MIRERCSRNRRGGAFAARPSDVFSGTVAVVRRMARRLRSGRRDTRAAAPRGQVVRVEGLGEGEVECAVGVRISLPEHDGEAAGCCMRIRLAG